MTRDFSQSLTAIHRSLAARRVQRRILSTPWTQTPVSTGVQESGQRQPLAHEERLEQLAGARKRQLAALRQAATRRSFAFFSARRPSRVDINFLNVNYDAQRARTKLKPLALPRRKWWVAAGLNRPRRRLLPTTAQRRLAHRGLVTVRPRRKHTFLRKSKRLQFLERLRRAPFQLPMRSQFRSISQPVLLPPELEPGHKTLAEHTVECLSSEFGRYRKRAFYSIREIWRFAQAYDKNFPAGQEPTFPTLFRLPDQNRQIYVLKDLRLNLILMEYRAFTVRVKRLMTDVIQLFIHDGHHRCVSELHAVRGAVALPALKTRPDIPKPRAVFATLRQLTRIARNHYEAVEYSSRRVYINGRNKARGLEHAAAWTLKLYRMSIELRMAEIAMKRKYWAVDYPQLQTPMQALLEDDMIDRPLIEQQQQQQQQQEEEMEEIGGEDEAFLLEAEVNNTGMPKDAPVAQADNMLIGVMHQNRLGDGAKALAFP